MFDALTTYLLSMVEECSAIVSEKSEFDYITKEEMKSQKVNQMIKEHLQNQESSWLFTIDFKSWNNNVHTEFL